MVSVTELKWIAVVSTLIGGLLGLSALCMTRVNSTWRARLFAIANAFSGGVFLGVALLHMLAEAQESLAQYDYPWAFFSAGVAAVVVHVLESTALPAVVKAMYPATADAECDAGAKGNGVDGALVNGGDVLTTTVTLDETDRLLSAGQRRSSLSVLKREKEQRARLVAIVLLVVVSIHSAFAGLALGVQSTMGNVGATMIAILVHKMVESFAICTAFLTTALSLFTISILMCAFSLVTPVFITIGICAFHGDDESLASGIITSAAAGSFLYLAVLIMMGEHSHDAPSSPDRSSQEASRESPPVGESEAKASVRETELKAHSHAPHESGALAAARIVAIFVGYGAMAALAIVA